MPKKEHFINKQHDSMLSIYHDRGTIEEAFFTHSVLCQTFLPYQNPGDEVRFWQQKQGKANLAISTTPVLNPQTNSYEILGIPYGSKSRLILAHINTQAIKTQSKIIAVEDSMTAFIKAMGLGTDGRTIKEVKEQLRRLSAATLSIGFSDGTKAVQANFQIVKAFDIWFPKNDSQRVLWPSTVVLSDDYFNSLMEHAIPLDERALAALSNNAMAIDIYSWLAQRLHRIPTNAPQFVAWQNLKDQFGQNYSRMDNFKAIFRKTLNKALMQYPMALSKVVEIPNKGFKLSQTQPPIIAKPTITISNK